MIDRRADNRQAQGNVNCLAEAGVPVPRCITAATLDGLAKAVTDLQPPFALKALGMAQSRVSNHLRLLREASMLTERHAGTSTYLRHDVAPPGARVNGHRLVAKLWDALADDLESSPEHNADLARLDAVLAERRARSGEFFDRVAESWDKRGVAFTTGQARQRAAVQLLPKSAVFADLGCGTGYFSRPLVGQCARLVCVDQSQGMLDEARRRLEPVAHGTELEFRQGELDALPFEDGELDGVIAGMVLHHVPDLDGPLTEMRRVLRPGGTAVVVELAPHRESWMRGELGDRHLGLDPTDVLAAFERAGLGDVALDPVEDRYQPTSPEGDNVSLDLYAVRGRVADHAPR